MNDNTDSITRYLQGEMAETERLAFEARLIAEPELQGEVDNQQLIMQAAVDAGIKNEFSKAMRRIKQPGKIIKWGLLAAACIISGIILFNFREKIFKVDNSPDVVTVIKESSRFVNPPLPAANVPFTELTFDAEKGDTFFYSSGSILHFPKSSLIDRAGNIVTGPVTVRYREFQDPLDFFVSGIPMSYDSAGMGYNFESSGMCEIEVFKEGMPLFVNPAAKPEILLSSKNKSPEHNLYYLDTAACQWRYRGKDQIAEVTATVKRKAPDTGAAIDQVYPKPVRPSKASEGKPSFSVEIDPGSFEELLAYNGLKFQVEDENNYRRSDADEHWDMMTLERTVEEGIYRIILTNARRVVKYKVRPVLVGADYEAAMKEFGAKNRAYELAKQNRLHQQKIESDSIEDLKIRLTGKEKADQERNDRVNNLVTARNKRVRALKAQMARGVEDPETVDELRREDFLLRNYIKMNDGSATAAAQYEILRSFTLDNFGIWNCDQPTLPGNDLPITATFKDSSGKAIKLLKISVAYPAFNGLLTFADERIRITPGNPNLIWGFKDDVFYYLPARDFLAADIRPDVKEYSFHMKSSGKVNSYMDLRKLMEDM